MHKVWKNVLEKRKKKSGAILFIIVGECILFIYLFILIKSNPDDVDGAGPWEALTVALVCSPARHGAPKQRDERNREGASERGDRKKWEADRSESEPPEGGTWGYRGVELSPLLLDSEVRSFSRQFRASRFFALRAGRDGRESFAFDAILWFSLSLGSLVLHLVDSNVHIALYRRFWSRLHGYSRASENITPPSLSLSLSSDCDSPSSSLSPRARRRFGFHASAPSHWIGPRNHQQNGRQPNRFLSRCIPLYLTISLFIYTPQLRDSRVRVLHVIRE